MDLKNVPRFPFVGDGAVGGASDWQTLHLVDSTSLEMPHVPQSHGPLVLALSTSRCLLLRCWGEVPKVESLLPILFLRLAAASRIIADGECYLRLLQTRLALRYRLFTGRPTWCDAVLPSLHSAISRKTIISSSPASVNKGQPQSHALYVFKKQLLQVTNWFHDTTIEVVLLFANVCVFRRSE